MIRSDATDDPSAAGPEGARGPNTKPAFGLTSAIALVVANMIGAGVFTTSGFSLADLGDREWVLLAWVVGGLIAVAGALSYGGLVRHICESGGEYLFLSRFIHPFAGFLAGWISLVAGFTGAIAFAAVTFAEYAAPGNAELARPLAIGVIVFFGGLHGADRISGVYAQNLIVAAKLLVVGYLVVAAGFRLDSWPGLAVEEPPQAAFSPLKFAGALVWISLAYSGFNAAVYVASEVRDGGRTVARSLWIGTAIVTVLYVALNAVFLYAPKPAEIAGQGPVALFAAKAVGGDTLATVVRVIICLALLSSVSSMIIAGPRVYARMADDGVFPGIFRFRYGNAHLAIALQSALAVCLVLAFGLKDLLSYLGLILSLSAAATVASLFVIARRGGSVRVPGYPFVPAFYILSTLILAGMSVQLEKWTTHAGAAGATIALGFVAWLFVKRRATSVPTPPAGGDG